MSNLFDAIKETKYINFLLSIFLWLWLFIGFWNRLLLIDTSAFAYLAMPSTFLRGGLLILITSLWIYQTIKKENYTPFVFVILPIVLIALAFVYEKRTYYDLKFIIKLITPFVFYYFLEHIKGKFRIEVILKNIKWMFLIQVGIVLSGWLFEMELFRSYPGTLRFGYSGIISRSSIGDASFFYMIMITLFYAMWRDQKIGVVFFVTSILAGLMLGTKAVILFVILIMVYHFAFESKHRFRNLLLFLFAALVFALIVYVATNFFDWFIELYKETGFWYTVTSKRNTYITASFLPYIKNIGWIDLLFGNGGFKDTLMEMDILDLFIAVGVIGSIIYLWALFTSLFNFTLQNTRAWFFVITFFLIGGLAGHVFASGLNAMFFAILCLYLQGLNRKVIVNRDCENIEYGC